MIKQRTIRSSVSIEGQGLQTGSKTKLHIKGAPANSGINFIRTDLPNKPLLNIQSISLDSTGLKKRRTIIRSGPVEIHTTEHLLSALSGLNIDNAVIEINGDEVPGLDGSAGEYVEALERAGIVEQDAPVKELVLKRAVWCASENAVLAAFPHDGFKISYFLSYPVRSIGEQFLSLDITADSFKKEIAPARTFCMKKEALVLKMLGFGKGANYKNTLIMGSKGPVNNELRFSDEPVRHKILDLIGDLSLVGRPLKAHIVAIKSGHSLNVELIKKLRKE